MPFLGGQMSALGQKQTFPEPAPMSEVGAKADIPLPMSGFGVKADMLPALRNVRS